MGEEKEYFIENLATMVSAGITINSSLDAISREARTRRMRRAIAQIKESIESGSSFWKALEKSKLFPAQAISLIQIGEESGRLVENLKVIALQQSKDRVFRSKIYSAMMYPVFVLVLSLIIGLGIAWFILPKLATVFASLNVKLPLITQILINVGTFLGDYGNIAVPSFVFVLIIFVLVFFVIPKTRFVGEFFLLKIPGIKRLLQESELGRTGYIMGTLLNAGLPVVRTLASIENASTFYFYRKFYRFLRENVEQGNSFQKSFELYKKTDKLIPPHVQQMIISGEQSGHLPEIFLSIGEDFEAKSDLTAKNLTVILEPIMLIIVWLGVSFIALAVILPIYSLLGGINNY